MQEVDARSGYNEELDATTVVLNARDSNLCVGRKGWYVDFECNISLCTLHALQS